VLRIAITALTTPASKRGVGRYLTNLIAQLQQLDSENEYTIYTAADNYSIFDIHAPNFNEVRLPLTHHPRWLMRPLYHLWQHTLLMLHMKRLGVDLFHLPNTLPLFFSLVPTVITIHDLTEFKVRGKYNWLRQKFRMAILPVAVRKANRVIAVSGSTKSDLVKTLGVPDGKIDVIYQAADTDLVCNPEVSAAELLGTRYGVRGRYILYVGTMLKHKNLPRLIRAFALLKNRDGLPHSLVIAGKRGAGYDECLAAVEECGVQDSVIFTGYLPDEELAAFYRGADLFVFPSLYEGFGLPLLEAMACGLPVVTSNLSSLPEVAGEAALLVDPYDVESLSAAMRRVLTEPGLGQELGRRGREQVRRFSWRRCAEETLAVYRKVAEGAGL
jgi:glycosyltransferase involved in cell wall biosynthesis